MYGKALFALVLVVIGAVLPYLLSDDKWLAKLESVVPNKPSGSAVDDASDNELNVKTTTSGKVVSLSTPFVSTNPSKQDGESGRIASASLTPKNTALEKLSLPSNGSNIPLTHLLSFNVTPEWVSSNWNRISTRVGELDLRGWRVPYYRYESSDDFAGSVTYYFDRERRVQRIVLHGYTSNPTPFLELAKTHYQMRRVPDPVDDLFVAVVAGQPIGGLHCTTPPLLNSKAENRQCELTLELNRQQTEYGMSYEFGQVYERARSNDTLLTPLPPVQFSTGA